jgi:hypothetical protein
MLPGQPEEQLLDVLIERRSPGSGVRVGPRAGDQPPMPAQQRLRSHEEARPTRSRQDAADRGAQGPVGRLQSETWGLAAQEQELWVVGGVAAGEQREQLDGAAQCQVASRGSTGVAPWWDSTSATVASRAAYRIRTSQALSEYLHPTGELDAPYADVGMRCIAPTFG